MERLRNWVFNKSSLFVSCWMMDRKNMFKLTWSRFLFGSMNYNLRSQQKCWETLSRNEGEIHFLDPPSDPDPNHNVMDLKFPNLCSIILPSFRSDINCGYCLSFCRSRVRSNPSPPTHLWWIQRGAPAVFTRLQTSYLKGQAENMHSTI